MSDFLLDRPLPASVEAEKAILGAIFLDNSAYYSCDNLTCDDFTLETHRKVYRAMMELVEDGKPIDFVTVGEVLGAADSIYVSSLTDGLPRVKNIDQYVNMVLEKSQRRKFILTMGRALDEAYDGDIAACIAETDSQILQIGQESKKSKPKTVKEITPRLYAEVERVQGLDPSLSAIGYRTGLEPLDKFTLGYHKGELTIIGGFTADGKTSAMRQGILAQMADQKPTLVFSGEETDEQILLALMAPMSNIKYSHLRDARAMDIYERPEFAALRPQIEKWPLWIDDATGLHIRELCARARAFIRREKVEIVFIDHTGKYHADGERHDIAVTNMAKALSSLAKSEDVPVVALHHLSRPEKGIKRTPRLSDLKDSTGVEQEAQTVQFVYRPIDKDGEFTELDQVIVAKQRHGEVGVVRARYDKNTLLFEPRG